METVPGTRWCGRGRVPRASRRTRDWRRRTAGAWRPRPGDGRAHGDEEAQRRGGRDVEAGAPADWEHARVRGNRGEVAETGVAREELAGEDHGVESVRVEEAVFFVGGVLGVGAEACARSRVGGASEGEGEGCRLASKAAALGKGRTG
jgi:hypothetical protein